MRGPLAFHVRREARDRYALEGPMFDVRGDLVVADIPAIRRLAARINSTRQPGDPSVGAGEIGALGLLHEIGHLLIARYEADRRPGAMAAALEDLEARLGPATDQLLDRFAEEFPGTGPDPEPPPHRLEELLLTRISNENPALGGLRELVDDRALAAGTRYRDAIAGLEETFADGPPIGPEGMSLIELMRMPARVAPTSLSGQLRYIRSAWAAILGSSLDEIIGRLDLAIGILAEEERALHQRFGGGGPGAGPTERPSFAGAAEELEAFSSDSAWMPQVVLMAKSTYVWLDQLSRTYARDIHTLDAIPDEELDTLARWGVTGLWLIGLWQRSVASERIKRMRGNQEAVASAYSLDDYRIADDIGGEGAYANLRDRAWSRGIRLASDMVPNHMGIDSRWVIEHPEWFLSLPEPPYPGYTYGGADLSSDPRVGIVLEDHYWDDSDAAVVFKRFDRETGDVRYVYHGNDGTSFPWNDTAQLNFLDARRPRAGHPDHPRCRAAVPDHPVRRRDGARQEAHRAAVVAGARARGRDPVTRRVRDPEGGVRCPDAGRVLAGGRRSGRGRDPRHPAPRRGVLAARGLLRPDARHAPRLQQRVHAHAPRRGRTPGTGG